MAGESKRTPLIVILGQTATGKSALGIEMAECFNGEIVSADSRAVYKKMDIGTAKPSVEDRRRIKHYLIDVIYPNQPFNVASYKSLAAEAISEIRQTDKIPFIIGGTGLYIDSVIYDYSFRPTTVPNKRAEFEAKSVTQLQNIVLRSGLELPNNPQNPRHLIRTIESGGQVSTRSKLAPDTLIIGIRLPIHELNQTIRTRMFQMIEDGLIDEVKLLSQQYDWELPSMQIPSYQSIRLFLENKLTLNQAIELAILKESQFAKRQAVWFKRNKYIHWIDQQIEVVDIITTFLNK
jgi:tRNA dimethylallyltransferase